MKKRLLNALLKKGIKKPTERLANMVGNPSSLGHPNMPGFDSRRDADRFVMELKAEMQKKNRDARSKRTRWGTMKFEGPD